MTSRVRRQKRARPNQRANPLFPSGASIVESFFTQAIIQVMTKAYASFAARSIPKTQPVPPLNAWQETVLQEMKR